MSGPGEEGWHLPELWELAQRLVIVRREKERLEQEEAELQMLLEALMDSEGIVSYSTLTCLGPMRLELTELRQSSSRGSVISEPKCRLCVTQSADEG